VPNEYYINRAFAAVGRLLQRHTGPIFPLIEDLFGVSIVEVHQQIAAVLVAAEPAERLKTEPGSPALEVQRTYKTSDGEIAQVTVNTHPASRFRHSMTMRRVRADDMPTLADSLAEAARLTPHRVVLVDGDVRLDCRSLHAQATTLARALLSGCPRQRGVVHAAELARGRRRLPGGHHGGNGGEPHPAVASGPGAALHPR
jgi:non-ribosomal peptide synthetase component F